MIRNIAVVMFVLVVGVCSYVLLNPNSYSTPVLCLAAFVLCMAAWSVAPFWRIYLLLSIQAIASGCRPGFDKRS
jgi:hypothetical protein